jgi:hypothetical protein
MCSVSRDKQVPWNGTGWSLQGCPQWSDENDEPADGAAGVRQYFRGNPVVQIHSGSRL